MSAIKSKDTKAELLVRRYLHKLGFRYRVHYKIAGRPDVVFPAYKVAIFINGCFWHLHECRNCILPKSNTDFWQKKLADNAERDKKNQEKLELEGWKTIIIWECELEKKNINNKLNNLSNQLAKLLKT